MSDLAAALSVPEAVQAQAQEKPEWVEPVRAFLLAKCFKTPERLATFQELLKRTGAVIAGGSVLRAIHAHLHQDNIDWGYTFDLDIYVPLKNQKDLLLGLYSANAAAGLFQNPAISSQYHASYYCRSFMRKNGIRSIQTRHIRGKKQPGEAEYNPRNPNQEFTLFTVDVMALRNHRSVQDVVTNFDLTFCQVWFDGERIFATHPEHIVSKKGHLRPDYVEAFSQRNKFIRGRLSKYKRRGFEITISAVTIPERVYGADSVPRCHSRPYEELIPHTVRRALLNMIHFMSDKMEQNRHVLVGNRAPTGIGAVSFSKKAPESILPIYDSPFWYQCYSYLRNGESFAQRDPNVSGRPDVQQLRMAVIVDDYDSEDEEDLLRATTALHGRIKAKNPAFPNTPEGMLNVLYSNLCNNSFRDRSYLESAKNDFHVYLHRRALYYKGLDTEDFDKSDDAMWNRMFNGKDRKKIMSYYRALFQYLMGTWDADGERLTPGKITADDTFGLGVPALALHLDDEPDTAISTDGFEAYLTGKMGEQTFDPYKIVCPLGCKQMLQLFEIREHVTKAFWKKFVEKMVKPQEITISLNQSVGTYDTMLTNRATQNAAFGMLHHNTICPFCLVPEERSTGCAYMTHQKPSGAADSDSPYCLSHLLIPELREKYKQMAIASLQRRNEYYGPEHLEFCVECGRPCSNHKHLNLKAGAEADFLDVPRIRDAQGQAHDDFGKCPVQFELEARFRTSLDEKFGDDVAGRAEFVKRLPRVELFARVSAIRDVFRSGEIRDGMEERKAAALAADAAATDDAMLQRAFRVLVDEKWDTDAPNTHEYTHKTIRLDPPKEIIYYKGTYFNTNATRNCVGPIPAELLVDDDEKEEQNENEQNENENENENENQNEQNENENENEQNDNPEENEEGPLPAAQAAPQAQGGKQKEHLRRIQVTPIRKYKSTQKSVRQKKAGSGQQPSSQKAFRVTPLATRHVKAKRTRKARESK